MLSPQGWLNSLMSAIELLADDRSQQRSWIDREPIFFPDWTELYCMIFDDSRLDDFIDGTFWRETTLTEEQHDKLDDLRQYLRKACSNLSDNTDSKDLLNISDWLDARAIAKDLLSNVDYSSGD